MKNKLLVVFAMLSMLNTLNAQIVKIDFDENIIDKVGIYSPEVIFNGEINGQIDSLFTSGVEGSAIQLDNRDGLIFPASLSEALLSDGSFEISVDFKYESKEGNSGQKTIVNFKSDRDWTSPGFNLYACRQCPFGDEVLDDKFYVRFLYADGLRATQGSDYSYLLTVDSFPVDEWININFIVDFEKRQWTIQAGKSYISQGFDEFFNFENVKEELLHNNPYLGWELGLQGDIDYDPPSYQASGVYDNLEIFVPKRPASVPTLKNALEQMTEEIRGKIQLTDVEKEQFKIDILSNFASNYKNAKQEIDSYLFAYETTNSPLFESREFVNITELSREAQITFALQQDILDNEYSNENIENMAGIYFEAAEAFPGIIGSNAKRIQSSNVEINATYITDRGYQRGGDYAIRPTGFYAAPGELVELITPDDLINKNIRVQVGAHNFDLTRKINEINRFPRITTEFEIIESKTTIANPFGGGIYIIIPDGTDYNWQTIEIKNAIKSPYFRVIGDRVTDIDEFLETLVSGDVLWADLESEMMMFTIPSGVIPNREIIDDMLTWDKIWAGVQLASGRPELKTRTEYYLIDSKLPYGGFGAGYPAILEERDAPNFNDYDAWWNPLRIREDDYLQNSGRGVMVHEMGHNMNFPTLPGELETVVQLVGVPGYTLGLDVPIDTALSYVEGESHTRDMAAMNWMISENFRTNQPMGCDPTMPPDVCSEKRYQIRAGMKYFDMATLFGWEKLGAINHVYYNRFKESDWFSEDVPFVSDQDYIATATQAIDTNVTPLLHFWGYIPEQNLKQELDDYPKSDKILNRLKYYKSLIPDDKEGFSLWYNKLKPTVDPVHYERYDWTLENYDSEGLAQQMKIQIDTIIENYFSMGTHQNNSEIINVPEKFNLQQNYPNPFNPSTQIQYALPEATRVTLDVFNSVGQKVMELVNGQKSAGYHTATFNASALSSGVYLYKLTTPSFTETKKMLLIK
jgi:hypothetical protein